MELASYPFRPITNEGCLAQAAIFIATKAVALGRTVLGRDLELDTICFFAHTPGELNFLRKAVLARGPQSRFTHGATLYADTDFTLLDWRIKIFGVRDVVMPDPLRSQVGYGDYPVTDYDALLEEIRTHPYVQPYARPITTGLNQSLIELRHPDFDVLGFIARKEEH